MRQELWARMDLPPQLGAGQRRSTVGHQQSTKEGNSNSNEPLKLTETAEQNVAATPCDLMDFIPCDEAPTPLPLPLPIILLCPVSAGRQAISV